MDPVDNTVAVDTVAVDTVAVDTVAAAERPERTPG